VLRISSLSQPFVLLEQATSKIAEMDLPLLESIEAQYAHLNRRINEILGFFLPLQEEWSYVVDPSTGLKILKVSKNPRALDEIEAISRRLYE